MAHILWNQVVDDYQPPTTNNDNTWVDSFALSPLPPSHALLGNDHCYLGEIVSFSHRHPFEVGGQIYSLLEDYSREQRRSDTIHYYDEYLDLMSGKKGVSTWDRVWGTTNSKLKEIEKSEKFHQRVGKAQEFLSITQTAYTIISAPNPVTLVWRLYSMAPS